MFLVGAGLRPTESTSVDLAFHRYRPAEAAPFLRDSALSVEPTGPGRAFARAHSSILFRVEVEYTFGSP